MTRTRPCPRYSVLLLALATAGAAPAALAQSAGDWNGGYLGGYLGQVLDPDDGNDRFVFDTNLDGRYGDTVTTAANADAFSPGSCNGVARGPTPAAGCDGNNGGAEWGLRAGYDWQLGRWVLGVVGDYGMNDARDAVSSFSTTPARYTMLRKLDRLAVIRGRVGPLFGEDERNLVYFTAGYATAKIENTFLTSNGVNTFRDSGDGDASGAQFGLGYERRVNDHLAMGIEYLRTQLKDDEYRVRAQGPAPATNPFIRQNPAGTDMRRSDDDFDLDSIRLTATYRF